MNKPNPDAFSEDNAPQSLKELVPYFQNWSQHTIRKDWMNLLDGSSDEEIEQFRLELTAHGMPNLTYTARCVFVKSDGIPCILKLNPIGVASTKSIRRSKDISDDEWNSIELIQDSDLGFYTTWTHGASELLSLLKSNRATGALDGKSNESIQGIIDSANFEEREFLWTLLRGEGNNIVYVDDNNQIQCVSLHRRKGSRTLKLINNRGDNLRRIKKILKSEKNIWSIGAAKIRDEIIGSQSGVLKEDNPHSMIGKVKEKINTLFNRLMPDADPSDQSKNPYEPPKNL